MIIIKSKVFEIKGTATRVGYGDKHYEKLVVADNATEAVTIWVASIRKELSYSEGEASSVLLQGEAIRGDYND